MEVDFEGGGLKEEEAMTYGDTITLPPSGLISRMGRISLSASACTSHLLSGELLLPERLRTPEILAQVSTLSCVLDFTRDEIHHTHILVAAFSDR
jgi:hypothetical protein